MGGVTIKLEGIGDAMKAFEELAEEIGDKKSQKQSSYSRCQSRYQTSFRFGTTKSPN